MAATQWPQATADERAAASGNIAKTIANSMCQLSVYVCVCVLYNEYICNICFHFIHLKCCVTFHNVAAVAEAARATQEESSYFWTDADLIPLRMDSALLCSVPSVGYMIK